MRTSYREFYSLVAGKTKIRLWTFRSIHLKPPSAIQSGTRKGRASLRMSCSTFWAECYASGYSALWSKGNYTACGHDCAAALATAREYRGSLELAHCRWKLVMRFASHTSKALLKGGYLHFASELNTKSLSAIGPVKRMAAWQSEGLQLMQSLLPLQLMRSFLSLQRTQSIPYLQHRGRLHSFGCLGVPAWHILTYIPHCATASLWVSLFATTSA